MEKLLGFLDSIHPMSAPLKEHLFYILRQKRLKRREFLLRKGHICNNICFLNSGLLHCFYTENDRKISSWFLKEGDVAISVQSFYSQQTSYESIQALEDCEIFYISYSDLQKIYSQFPHFNHIGRVLTEKYYVLKEQHSYQLQKTYARERYDW